MPILSFGQGWVRTFGSTTASEQGYSIVECSDGDFLMAGSTSAGDPLIIKIGSGGGPLKWARYYSHGGFGIADSPTLNDYHRYLAWVEKLSNGGYVIATGWDCSATGVTTPGREMEMIKYDASGTFQWRNTYGNSADLDPGISLFAHDAASSVKQTTDGGFILAGYSEFGSQYWTVAAGTITTSTASSNVTGVGTAFNTVGGSCYGGPGLANGDVLYNSTGTFIGYVNSVTSATALTLISNAAVTLAGSAWAFDNCSGFPDDDVGLIKTSSTGALQWELAFGGSTSSSEGELGALVIQTTDGGYAVAGGYAGSDLYLSKIPNAGTPVTFHRKISSTGTDDIAGLVQATDGSYVLGSHGGPSPEGFALINVPNNGTSAPNWSNKYMPANLAGTITTSTASKNVTGTGTAFNTDLAATYTIYTSGGTKIGVISTIGSATTCTLVANAAVTLASQPYTLCNVTTVDAYNMIKTNDGGYAMAGSAFFGDYGTDAIMLKTNVSGTFQWAMRYGDSNAEYGMDLKQTTDGGYIIGGYSNNTVYPAWPTTTPSATTNDFLYIKTDASGNSESAYTRTLSITTSSASFTNAAITVDHSTTTLWKSGPPGACGSSSAFTPTGFQANGAVLPVKLLALTGKYQNKKTYIDWATSSEMNNDYFTVERSTDENAEEWEDIGKVNGAGNSNYVRHYSLTDNNLPVVSADANLYYRLKQTDYNGQSEYYGPIAVTLVPDEEILIHTNATNEQFLVSFPESLEGKNCSIKIYDMSGRVSFSTSFIPGKFKNDMWVDIANFSKGVYIISAISENGISCRKKFVKQ